MSNQEVKYIKVSELVLWTENPRDTINPSATAQEVTDLALLDTRGKWSLPKLAKEMGDEYDLSELPTVVYHDNIPVVYDGNRRVILGKIKHGLVQNTSGKVFDIPIFPENIPCNVCSQNVALKNIFRKHGDSGSWSPLERDVFLNKHMNHSKSAFLILEETTGLISKNPHLNQRFVKEEIFDEDHLSKLGFEIKNHILNSKHSDAEATLILEDLSAKIHDKEITTRKNRGEVIKVLDKTSKTIIGNNKTKETKPLTIETIGPEITQKQQRQTRRVAIPGLPIFGGKLFLNQGNVNNLYKDIAEIYHIYEEGKVNFSDSFIGLIRMSLRLITEMAASELNLSMDKYLKANFSKVKVDFDQNLKTTLSAQNVSEATIAQHLHTGAHNYQTSLNKEQALAISVVLGAILTISHGKKD